MLKSGFAFLYLILSFYCSSQNLNIIPQPSSVKINKGNFVLSKKTVIAVRDEADKKAAEFFNQYLKNHYGFELDIDKQESKNYIRINTKKFIQAPGTDAYQMNI